MDWTNWTNWLYLLMGIFCIVITIVVLVKDIKEARNTAPHGKTFTKKFYEKLVEIHKAGEVTGAPGFISKVKGLSFTVNIVKDEVPKGLEYETIPIYKSYCVYVDNEAVCRAHILQIDFKDKIYLEFSSKRKYAEVIEIVESVYTQAKEALAEYNKKWYNADKQSFFYNKDLVNK